MCARALKPVATTGTSSRLRAANRRLAPPEQTVDLVERTLLLRTLEETRPIKLTVIVGPAGYGKTTLLAQWWRRLKRQGVSVAWYTASDADREPVSFLKMLAMSLDAGGVGMADASRRTMFDAGPEVVLDAILHGLQNINQPTLIIIDDFDKVDHPSISRLLEDLVEDLPKNIHLALSARRKPSLAVSRLRVRGSMRIVEPKELCLSNDELSRALDLAIDSPELISIARHTEGWPVAVQLYRFWRRRIDHTNAVAHFSGQAAEVVDFLAEQVFAVLEPGHQQLLVDLSILEYLEPALADHIRQASDSAQRLHEVADVLPALVQQSYSEGEPAYRLHPLVSDYARSKLTRIPDRAPQLHWRAAEWLWQHHRYADAIRHAVRSRRDAALRTMLDTLPFFEIFLGCGVSELRPILQEIPQDLTKTLPRIQLAVALVHLKTGFFGEAQAMLQRTCDQIKESHSSGDPDPRIRLDILALQLLFSTYIDGISAPCKPLIDKIRALAPNIPVMWAWCENSLIVVHQGQGDLDAARKALNLAKEAYATGVVEFASTQMFVHELLLGLAHGDWRETSERSRALLRRAPSEVLGERCLASMAKMALAAVDYERSFRPGAADTMRLALDQYGEGEAWFDLYAIAFPVIIDVTYRQHGVAAAAQHVARLQERLRLRGMRCVGGLLRCLEVLYHVRSGEISTAAQLAAEYDLDAAYGPAAATIPWRQRDIALKTIALLALAHSDYDKAVKITSLMIEEGRLGARRGTHIKGLVLSARIHERHGAPGAADDAIGTAIRLAYPEGHVAQFAEEGAVLGPLLQRIITRTHSSLEAHHVAAILRAIDNVTQSGSCDVLSDREAEIVAHLADRASNKLIARRLGLTENTVKFHLKKIYAKLGVASRRAAVSRFAQDR